MSDIVHQIPGSDADEQKNQFMKLLVTQLQYQNPLEPMSETDMAAQLAQFTQLELTENSNRNIEDMTEAMNSMNASFQGAMVMAEYNYAKGFLGKDVVFHSGDYGQNILARVKKVKFDGATPVLEVEGSVDNGGGQMSEPKLFEITPSEILGVKNNDM
jgi:flagellar basal-body rod modification protein FlgD